MISKDETAAERRTRRINSAHLAMWRARNRQFQELWCNIYHKLEKR